jgi:hypothetical protein
LLVALTLFLRLWAYEIWMGMIVLWWQQATLLVLCVQISYLHTFIGRSHYKKNCILRPLKWQIATVRRVADVQLRPFPNSHGCWGRKCLLRPFIEQPHQLPQKALRQLLRVANEEIQMDFKGLATVGEGSQMHKIYL